MYYRLPLIFEPQPEGGYTVTSPLLPDLLTEGETVADGLDNITNAPGSRARDLPRARKAPSSRNLLTRPLPTPYELRWSWPFHEILRRGTKALDPGVPQRCQRTGDGSHRKWLNPATGNSTVLPDWGAPRPDLADPAPCSRRLCGFRHPGQHQRVAAAPAPRSL